MSDNYEFEKALHAVRNEMQRVHVRFEKYPLRNRSEIIAEITERLRNIRELKGVRNGTNALRLHLIGLAAFCLYAAASMIDNRIGHD